MGVRVGVTNFFWGQSIGIVETNTFQLTFFSSVKIVGAKGLTGKTFLDQSIGINKTYTFQLQFFI